LLNIFAKPNHPAWVGNGKVGIKDGIPMSAKVMKFGCNAKCFAVIAGDEGCSNLIQLCLHKKLLVGKCESIEETANVKQNVLELG
jgi:hypothetical protein